MATQPGGNLGFNPYAPAPAASRLEKASVSPVQNQAVRGSETSNTAPQKSSSWDDNTPIPPAKADAAPSGSTTKVFTGLCDALNQFQQSLVRPGGYKIADQYEIQFNPASIASAKIAIKGEAYKATPTIQEKTPNAQLNQDAQRMDLTGRIVQVGLGTQIVQFIDQVMRQSSYITDQANFIFDESTGKLTPKPNAPADANVNWYKVNFQTKNLGWDDGRNDYAYKMIYTITPYSINRMDSQYFPEGRYHGVHKSYNYWFTGKNNAVLNFEQEYNQMYFTILSGTNDGVGNGTTVPIGLANTPTNDPIGKEKSTSKTPKSYAPASSQSSQGAALGVNELGASAADYLYSMVPPGEVKMRIIGDPAWIPQGEVTNSINAATMTFAPFFPDGTINMDAGQVMFDIYFNRPADYNFDTGIVNVNGQTINPGGTLAALQPQAHLTYTCSSVKSFFMQGKFEQELTGLVYKDGFDQASAKSPQAKAQAAQSVREKEANDVATATGTRNSSIKPIDQTNPDLWDSEPSTNTNPPAGDITNPSPQPASPKSEPISNGDLTAPATNSAPQNTLQAQIQNVAAANRDQIQPLTLEQQQIRDIGARLNTQTQTMAPKDDA